MKKFITKISAVAIVSASLFGASAFAKTEGAFVGGDLSYNKSHHSYRFQGVFSDQVVNLDEVSSSGRTSILGNFDDKSLGYGLNYKYAFNFNGIFLAPSVFYEKIDTVANDSTNNQVSVNSRHGVKLDLGYDITDNFALYIMGGIGVVDYEINFRTTQLGNVNGKNSSFMKGLGFNYVLNDNWLVNGEYNIQDIDLEGSFLGVGTHPDGHDIAGIDIYNAKTQITSYKIGLAYKF